MDGYYVFLILLFLYLAAMVGIGLYLRKNQKSAADFWLAGREVGALNIGLSAAAAWLSAFAIYVATGLFILIGVGSVWIWVVPNILALLIIALLVKKIKSLPAFTQPELVEIRFSHTIRAPIAIAITITMILFSVADFKGFQYVLSQFYGIEPIYAVLIMGGVVAAYITLGGFRAVIWTDVVQYVFLAALAVIVGIAALYVPMQSPSGFSISGIFGNPAMGGTWWDPFLLGGIAGIVIMQLALLPGWVAEQDPWQKVWAARDTRTAQRGMALGSIFITAVYAFCFVTALGLIAIYGMPQSPAEAEQMYLKFIIDAFPPGFIAFFAIGFAAAAMSCTDTFATSGASCISRDIYQRYVKPGASQRELRTVNRVLVVLMLIIAGTVSLFVNTIMDAVIIATVIGTASYFFPIIGGMFWKRATKEGAIAALVIGGGVQVLLVLSELFIIRMKLEEYFANYFFGQLLIEHGVLLGLSLSAISFVGVSLLTRPPEDINLAPFFPEVAEGLFRRGTEKVDDNDPGFRTFAGKVGRKVLGEREHLRFSLDIIPAASDGGTLDWTTFVSSLKTRYSTWYTPTGIDTVYRLTRGDMLSCVAVVMGDTNQLWFSAEPEKENADQLLKEMYVACSEITDLLRGFNISSGIST